MAETPSQTPTPPRSASEAETETMEYWCYQCNKRVSIRLVNLVERRSKGGSESTTLILFIFCNPRPAPSHPTKTPPPCKRSLRQEQEALAAAARSLSVDEQDLLTASYGDVPLIELQSKTAEDISHWTKVGSLTSALENRSVLIRGRAHTIRAVGKNMALVVVRERGFTVQCVATVHPDTVSRQMVKYVAGLSRDAAGGSSNEEVILCE
ncbi:hypothetical protein ACFX2I_011720 [Malus domestica]